MHLGALVGLVKEGLQGLSPRIGRTGSLHTRPVCVHARVPGPTERGSEPQVPPVTPSWRGIPSPADK